MIFGARLKLAKEVDKLMNINSIKKDTFGVVTALQILGYLKDKKGKKNG